MSIKNIERKGQLAIFTGSKYREPCLVFCKGINDFGSQVLEVMNGTELFFTDPDKRTLLDFDYNKLKMIRAEWNLENAKQSVHVMQERLNELRGE